MKRTVAAASTAALLLLLSANAGTARGALVTYLFSGEVTALQGDGGATAALTPPFTVGDTFTFSFTIDDATVDTAPSPSGGVYAGASDATFTYSNGYSGSASIPVTLNVVDSSPSDLFTTDIESVTAPQVGGLDLGGFEFELIDSIGATAFSSDALPTSFTLSDFETRRFDIFFDDADEPTVRGLITSATVTAVPEGSALLFLGLVSAAAGVNGVARRRTAR